MLIMFAHTLNDHLGRGTENLRMLVMGPAGGNEATRQRGNQAGRRRGVTLFLHGQSPGILVIIACGWDGVKGGGEGTQARRHEGTEQTGGLRG